MTPTGAAENGAEQHKERPAGPLVRECSPPYKRQSGQVAAVLLYDNGGHSVLWPDRREEVNKPWFRSEFTAFEVLLGLNITDFELTLPAAGDAQNFEARVTLEWEVVDPYLVVSRRVWDIGELLRGALLDGLRKVSRRFSLTQAQRVDEAVQEELRAGRLDLGRELGLRTTVRVFIDLSEQVRTRLGEVDDVDFGMSLRERQLEAKLRSEQLEQRLVRNRARELEEVLRRGEEAEIIHYMAKNPEKEWEIRQAVQREKRERQTDFLNLFNRLIDTGILERHDIGEQTYEVLQYLKQSTGGVIDTVTERRSPERPLRRRPRRRAIEERAARPEPEPEPERPFWEDADDADDADRADADAGVREDPAGGGPRVHEPTRVESASERGAGGRSRAYERRGVGAHFDDPLDPIDPIDPIDPLDPLDPFDETSYDEPRGRDPHPRNSSNSRNSRPSSAFDDWGDE